MKYSPETQAKFIILADMLFVVAPIFLLFIVKLNSGTLCQLFTSPDIGYANIVLFGQTIVRLVSGIARSKKTFSWQLVALLVAAIIVLGLFPASAVLFLTLSEKPNAILFVFQWILFAAGLMAYFVLGTLGQKYHVAE